MPTTKKRITKKAKAKKTKAVAIAKAIKPTKAKAKEPFGFKIGADPEFVLLTGEKFLPANQTMQAFMAKLPGTVAVSTGYNIGDHGNIGWDGAAMTGEIRPTAEDKPSKVVEHIGALMAAAVRAMPFADISPLSFVNPTGGHIHLEVPRDVSTMTAKRHAKLLTHLSLPIMAGEHPVSSKYRRNHNSYGKLEDIRVEQKFVHSDGLPGYTAEVRFPTPEWLITPHIAEATLLYFAVLWDALLNDAEFRNRAKKMALVTNTETTAVVTILTSGYAGTANYIIGEIRKIIRTAPRYEEFKNELEFIMNPKAVLAEKEKASWLINTGWKFAESPKQPNKREFISQKAVTTILKNKDESITSQYSPISFNDDVNVSVFAAALNERAIAFGWRPKHEYFLFGIKDGKADEIVAKDSKGFYSGAAYGTTLADTLTRMQSRALDLAKRSGNRIDVRTGQMRSQKDPIVIGIPYAMRTDKQLKDFLSLIVDIERGELAPSPALAGEAAKTLESSPSLEHAQAISTSVASNAEAIMNELNLMSRTDTESHVDLNNIANWSSAGGSFELETIEDLMDGYGSISSGSLSGTLASLPTDTFIAYYSGHLDTIVCLGNDADQAYAWFARVFGYDTTTMVTHMHENNRRVIMDDSYSYGEATSRTMGYSRVTLAAALANLPSLT